MSEQNWEGSFMEYSRFVVDEVPFCVWEWDLHERNLAFIESLDPQYFEYLADSHSQGLEMDEKRQRAALALRTAYSHGLETLFALLFATLQAPDCIIGWLHKYEIRHLRNLVTKVRTCRDILSKLKIDGITWTNISETVLIYLSLHDKEKESRIKRAFATLWERFADDFMNDRDIQEYNSIKHGLRLRSGGFALAVAEEATPGVAAPPERMRSLGGSEYGSSFFVPEQISANKLHFRVRHYSRNWKPENFIYGLHLISMSLRNIISSLKVINGRDPKTVHFSWPNKESHFDEPWRPVGGPVEIGIDTVIQPEGIRQFTKDEIIAVYAVDGFNSERR